MRSKKIIDIKDYNKKLLKIFSWKVLENIKKGKKIVLTLGFSHPVEYNLPEGVDAKSENQTEFNVSSNNIIP